MCEMSHDLIISETSYRS